MYEERTVRALTNQTISIFYENETHTIPIGTSLSEAVTNLLPARFPAPLAAVVNGTEQELDYTLYTDSQIIWLDYTSAQGNRIYKRSLNFVLVLACQTLFPARQLRISHSLNNGTYCQFQDELPLTQDQLAAIETEMRRLIEQDLPVIRREVSKDDAISFFKEQGKTEKAAVLSNRVSNKIKLYTCAGLTEYFYGRMVTHIGLLNNFVLSPFDTGFVLSLPSSQDANFTAIPHIQPKKLQATIQSYQKLVDLLQLDNVCKLNKMIENGEYSDLIQIAETIHERSLHKISDDIAATLPETKIVLVAGPSSSGKTTFTHRLAIQFRSIGIKPLILSLDNYFINRAHTPRDEEGNLDFESLYALDLELFNDHLQKLIAGAEIPMPCYNFTEGCRSVKTQPLQLQKDGLLLIEGIHGLNDELTQKISAGQKKKIYISALSQLRLDDYNPLASSDHRLLRRMVRDRQFRGTNPQETLLRWPSVRRGESKNIFPYQENADFYFNSALVYELPAIRPLIEPDLQKIEASHPAWLEAKRLLRLIQYFLPAKPDNIPLNSIAQEFIGKSLFHKID